MQLDRDARRLISGLLADHTTAELIQFAAKDNSEEAIKLGVPPRFPSVFQLVVNSADSRDANDSMILELTADLVLPLLAKYLEANAMALQMAGVSLPAGEKEFDIPEQGFGGMMPGAIAGFIKDAIDQGKNGMAFRLTPEGKLEPVPEDELPTEVRERFKEGLKGAHHGVWPTASTFMESLPKATDTKKPEGAA